MCNSIDLRLGRWAGQLILRREQSLSGSRGH